MPPGPAEGARGPYEVTGPMLREPGSVTAPVPGATGFTRIAPETGDASPGTGWRLPALRSSTRPGCPVVRWRARVGSAQRPESVASPCSAGGRPVDGKAVGPFCRPAGQPVRRPGCGAGARRRSRRAGPRRWTRWCHSEFVPFGPHFRQPFGQLVFEFVQFRAPRGDPFQQLGIQHAPDRRGPSGPSGQELECSPLQGRERARAAHHQCAQGRHTASISESFSNALMRAGEPTTLVAHRS